VDEGGEHAADDGSGEGLHDLDAGARAPGNREQAGDRGGDGHDFRAQAETGAGLDGGEEFGAIKFEG